MYAQIGNFSHTKQENEYREVFLVHHTQFAKSEAGATDGCVIELIAISDNATTYLVF